MSEPNAKSHFTEFLKRHQLRNTPERFEVLDAVLAHKSHFDADELFLRLKSGGSKVSRATVYNTLDKLTRCGIVSRYRFGENLSRYELVYGVEPHHHIICRSCGRIEEFSDRRVERLAEDAARTMGYQLHDHALHLYGLCSDCASSRSGNTL